LTQGCTWLSYKKFKAEVTSVMRIRAGLGWKIVAMNLSDRSGKRCFVHVVVCLPPVPKKAKHFDFTCDESTCFMNV
jgi:hypothetical protein